ncbi:hypothetical protein TNCV_1867511 [Trichonephila clavipes]|nr:hypothetical protein TNCV_1867511 [Trichonephila clavipes]
MHLIEDETFNDSDIINNLIDYEDGQEKPDSLSEWLKYMQGCRRTIGSTAVRWPYPTTGYVAVPLLRLPASTFQHDNDQAHTSCAAVNYF